MTDCIEIIIYASQLYAQAYYNNHNNYATFVRDWKCVIKPRTMETDPSSHKYVRDLNEPLLPYQLLCPTWRVSDAVAFTEVI